MVLGVPKNRLASGSVLQHPLSITLPRDATIVFSKRKKRKKEKKKAIQPIVADATFCYKSECIL